MKKLFYLCVLIIAGMFFIGCDNSTGTGTGTKDLPIMTRKWEVMSNGYTQFYTNDPKNYECGFRLVSDNGNKNTYEIDCRKMDGYQGIAYGMLFSVSNSNMDDYYFLMITCDGSYRIRKTAGEDKTFINNWTDTDAIKPGYGNLNNLKVVRSEGDFLVYINSQNIFQFTDEEFGKRIGFYAGVSSEEDEDFPNRPVDVQFKIKK